ncbi:DUF4147 domain-containing protein [Candidatus Bipolaricaulota bacterium]|nr:DUF4147 domain-containing protein [Candidatus Bipolaricaulota bacterium]
MSKNSIIKNRKKLLQSVAADARELALDLFETGISATLPEKAMRRHLEVENELLFVDRKKYDLTEFDRILVLGGGKASLRMALSLEETLGQRIDDGLVIVKSNRGEDQPDRIEVKEGSHPLPEARGLRATEELLKKARSADEKDLVICLISGGGSALLASPGPGIGLEDIRVLTEVLLESGASIDEINALRKTVSGIKGGKLARSIHPATTLSLIASDVVGDDLRYIASGPTVPDNSGSEDALEVIRKNDLEKDVPGSVMGGLRGRGRKKLEGPVSEKEFSDFNVTNRIIVSNETALSAIAEEAEAKNISSIVLSSRLEGESKQLGKLFGQLAKSIHEEERPLSRPGLLLSGGEATVTLSGGNGKGGPNQEFTSLPPWRFEVYLKQ